MKNVHYPTHYTVDFDETTTNIALDILHQQPATIFSTLINLLNNKDLKQLTCLLHIILESKPSKLNVTLIGWFTVNKLIPPPTLYLIIAALSNSLNSKKGVRHAIVFARAIYPRLNKFTNFCKALKAVPNLEYIDSDIYQALSIFIIEQVVPSYYDTRYHFYIPKPKSVFHSSSNFIIPSSLPIFNEEQKYQQKNNFLESMKFASMLPEDSKYSFYIHSLLQFKPQKHYQDASLLKAACNYTLSLFNDAKSIHWESYDFHHQIERLGFWISCLSIQNGPPPPFYLLPIQKLIRSSISDGSSLEILIFLNGFFTDLPKNYKLPNPYTRSIIEMVSSLADIDSLRTDILFELKKFEKKVKIDLTLFKHRTFNAPRNSSIRFTQFLLYENGSIIFQTPKYLHINEYQMLTNNPEKFYSYFYYVPNIEIIPDSLKEIITNIKIAEKYYFVGLPSHIKLFDDDSQELVQFIVSLSLSKDRTMAKFFTKMLYKIIKHNNIQIDFSSVFRFAFPSEDMIKLCFQMNCLSAVDINALFSELLTNPITRNISFPKIIRLMPICLKMGTDSKFTSTIKLLHYQGSTPTHISLPMPDASNMALLRSFLFFCKNPGDRSDFIDRMEKPTFASIRSLILFVLNSTTKSRSSANMFIIDYSTIDWLCFAFSKCSGKLNLENHAVKVLESIADSAISVCPKPFFRLIYGLLGSLFFQNTERLIQLLDNLSPSKYPSFACCWIQIIMHKTVFPRFLKQNSIKLLFFCVKFLMICFQLCEITPEVFYKPVARILMTISSSNPLFFVSYAPLIFEKLPLNFIQFRNIILNASVQSDPESPPPMGFSSEKTLQVNDILPIVEKIISEKEKEIKSSDIEFINKILKRDLSNINTNINSGKINNSEYINETNNNKNTTNNFHNKTSNSHYSRFRSCFHEINDDKEPQYVPKNISHFFIYCFTNYTVNIRSMLIQVFNSFMESEIVVLRLCIAAVVDQIRYQNSHSFSAINFFLELFENTTDISRELILIELLKRSLCITAPPQMLISLFKQINIKFGSEIKRILTNSNEYKTYIEAKNIIDQISIPRSPSGHITVILNK